MVRIFRPLHVGHGLDLLLAGDKVAVKPFSLTASVRIPVPSAFPPMSFFPKGPSRPPMQLPGSGKVGNIEHHDGLEKVAQALS